MNTTMILLGASYLELPAVSYHNGRSVIFIPSASIDADLLAWFRPSTKESLQYGG